MSYLFLGDDVLASLICNFFFDNELIWMLWTVAASEFFYLAGCHVLEADCHRFCCRCEFEICILSCHVLCSLTPHIVEHLVDPIDLRQFAKLNDKT